MVTQDLVVPPTLPAGAWRAGRPRGRTGNSCPLSVPGIARCDSRRLVRHPEPRRRWGNHRRSLRPRLAAGGAGPRVRRLPGPLRGAGLARTRGGVRGGDVAGRRPAGGCGVETPGCLSTEGARLGPMPPGVYRDSEVENRAVGTEIVLLPGENRLVLRAAPTEVLEVVLPEGTGELSLRCSAVNGPYSDWENGPPGATVTFAGLLPGRYRLDVRGLDGGPGDDGRHGAGTGPRPLRRPGGDRPQGPAEAAGRRRPRARGDASGRPRRPDQGKGTPHRGRGVGPPRPRLTRDASTITIRRGEAEFDVTLPAAQPYDSDRLGGWFDPVGR